MRVFVIISALMAVAVTAAPTPCNEYTCQKIPPPGGDDKPDVGPGDFIKAFIP
ncbi:uncharacterized protein LY79DRAFT_706817 [Colletotrichum navitas]|uniref:Uncharacterized protein n=1 Tax=Colletotrichum navitas TaxID=681940 RepID=A0AAD8V055_9PEZI|nr:uncharacterized protein LY79DRAFT_706817 [Colletotrichum navitas]KAK1573958.1 hypothetical protein LY79DRAFT_706817 [Colletotrichum navitas]